jgi:hypothetical protein
MVGGEGDDVRRKLIELRYGDQFEQNARYTVEHAEDFLFMLRPDLAELDEHLGEWLQARDAGLWTDSDRELWEDLQAEIERFRGRWAATKRGEEVRVVRAAILLAERSPDRVEGLSEPAARWARDLWMFRRDTFHHHVVSEEYEFGLPPLVDLARFLAEATAAGVAGNLVYDGIKTTILRVRDRWAARQQRQEQQDRDRRLAMEEAAELARAAAAIHLEVEEGRFVALSSAVGDDGWWIVDLADRAGRADEIYRVALPPGQPDQARIIIFRRPRDARKRPGRQW